MTDRLVYHATHSCKAHVVALNSGPAGTISATHGDDEMTATVEAFRTTIWSLRREGALP